MKRRIRYEGAMTHNHHILLIKHPVFATGHSYWIIPGGGIEEDETEEACVIREMREETLLQVNVERLLLDEVAHPGSIYQRHKAYLCTPLDAGARPGYEPEPEAAAKYEIVEVVWFGL